MSLLDRNMVIEVQRCQDRQREMLPVNSASRRRLRMLRWIDRPNNVVSAVPSAFEGTLGSSQTAMQFIECLRQETFWLGNFFARAHVDNYFISGNREAALIHGPWKTQLRSEALCIPFLEAALPIVGDEVAAERAIGRAEKVLEISEAHKMPYGHPLVITLLACLFQNRNARMVLKPRRFTTEREIAVAAYNGFSDISKITLLAYVRCLMKPEELDFRILLITDDTPLRVLGRQLAVTATSTELPATGSDPASEVVAFTSNVRPSLLFPNLDTQTRRGQILLQRVLSCLAVLA